MGTSRATSDRSLLRDQAAVRSISKASSVLIFKSLGEDAFGLLDEDPAVQGVLQLR